MPGWVLRSFAAACAVASLAAGAAAQRDPSAFGGLRWRLVGPFRGGRALAVTGVPGSPEKFYFGGVGGGVWLTENAGRTWTPIFDSQPVASIGAIAVAPSDPNVIYVGSGEADMRSDIQQGDGMYKSTDAGKTWSKIGLEDTRQIGKIVVDPTNPDVAYVAALGHQYGPNEERGVFKTTDGGKTWAKVLYKSPDVGAIDLSMDPTDPNVVYASMWQTRRPPWTVYPPSNGPGSGVYKTTDGGSTWTQLQNGLPASVGHVGLCVSPADHNRVYAVVDTTDPKKGGLYRSDDAGAIWTLADNDGRIWGRGWYFCGVTADPKNADTVYVMNTSTYRSTDGGKTFVPVKGAPGGDDYHTMWIDPNDASRLALASDQGVVISVDGAKSWSSWYNQPTGQFYHVVADNRFPYWIYGAQQDSGAAGVPSRTIHTGISALDWRPMDVGGESGTIAPDPLHPGLLYGNNGGKEELDDAWEQGLDPTATRPETAWRSTWTTPVVFSPANPHALYLSHQKVFRSDNGGETWKVISPDLTRPSNTVPGNLDPTTVKDSTGLPRRGVVYWLSPSPLKAKQLWAGTDDGLIWLTRDDGVHWKNVTPAALTPWSKVGVVDASHFDANTAYAAVDRHRLDDNRPYVYRTRDGGKRWKLVTSGLPTGQFVNVVREDPKKAGLLYAGTDRGVFVSFDAGDHWQPLQINLPAASVRDIVFGDNDVVVGTHGRAIWILDDASPLRQPFKPGLVKPAKAMIFQRAGTFGFGAFDEGTPFPPEEPQGQNPAWGAVLDYVVSQPGTPVVFTITDSKGKLVRRLRSGYNPPPIDVSKLDIPAYWVHPEPGISTEVGAHRVWWDFRYRSADGPLVVPGRYYVHLTANYHRYTQPLTVVKDPRIKATQAELQAQFDLSVLVKAQVDRARADLARIAALTKQPGMSDSRRRALEKSANALKAVSTRLEGLLGEIESGQAAPASEIKQAVDRLVKRGKVARLKLIEVMNGR